MNNDLQSLELWRHALTASVRADSPDLSARQMALLLSVYLGEGPHTVRGMAKDLRISKPAISRALDRLGELGYIRRKRDETDRRNVIVQRTVKGSVFLVEFASLIRAAQLHLAQLPPHVTAKTLQAPEDEDFSDTPERLQHEGGWIEAA